MKLATFAAAMMIAAPAIAETPETTCGMFGDLAYQIMELRQKDAPMAAMVDAMADNPARELIVAIIIDAYDQPSYSVHDNQREAAAEFRNDIYLACIKEVRQ